tara:strand:+ start:5666 stop:5947 length:282 start_codon:yes stop_codon:yes gene_type:complete
MTVIKFQTREERAFAKLVEEGKKLEGQGFFVITEDDEKVKPSSSVNIIAFPTKGSALDSFEAQMEQEEDFELAALVMERQNDLIIEIDLDDLL